MQGRRFLLMQEQAGIRLNRCAGGILWRGQEKGAARIGNTGKPFDEPTTQKTPALRVALRRAPAASPRSTVLPDTLFAVGTLSLPTLADRLAATQRSGLNLITACSDRAQP
jgi:hypothetical protein